MARIGKFHDKIEDKNGKKNKRFRMNVIRL